MPLRPNRLGDAASEVVVLVGNPRGWLIGEIDCSVMGVAWKLNDYGQARLRLSRAVASTMEPLLRPGNRLLIQFGNGLPDWGGILDLPRKWQTGVVDLVGYSGERLLVDRVTGRDSRFVNVSAGRIFASLMGAAAPSGITLGSVWDGPELLTMDFHYRSLYDIFQKSLGSQIGDGDWQVEAQLIEGQITFQAHFFNQRGTDHGRRVALLEGVNLADVVLQEQGPVVNEWLVAGAGSGWGDGERLYGTGRDEASVEAVGLRQRGLIRVDLDTQATLDQATAVALAEFKEPHSTLDLTALDLAPARYSQYDIGDSVWVELYETRFGDFESSVRVVAREYFPQIGACSLVVE